jgi:hypothetical protein
MLSKMRITAIVAIVLMGFVGYALASPPVPPPVEGFGITTSVDVEMSSGDFTETEAFTWTWMHDNVREGRFEVVDTDGDGIPDTAVTFRGSDLMGDMRLATGGRAAQIRYTEEMQSTDTSFFQFNKDFAAASASADTEGNNLKVAKNYGYVASEASLIANASNQERVGLSIVANGDTAGLGDMPSLCPWAQGRFIPATNEFIAMGSDTSTTSVMVSDTNTEAVATRAPEVDHTISASGIGMAQGLMKLSLMEGNSMYSPEVNAHSYNPLWPGQGTGFAGPPNLQSKTDYYEKTQAIGTIEKFTKGMHYHSTIPQYQMPEPWYAIQ